MTDKPTQQQPGNGTGAPAAPAQAVQTAEMPPRTRAEPTEPTEPDGSTRPDGPVKPDGRAKLAEQGTPGKPAEQGTPATTPQGRPQPAPLAGPPARQVATRPGFPPPGYPMPPPGWQPAAGWRPPPPRPPSAFALRWPGPGGGAGPLVLAGAVATGLAAAAAVPLDRPGIGWLVPGVVAAAVLVAVARRVDASEPLKVDAPASTGAELAKAEAQASTASESVKREAPATPRAGSARIDVFRAGWGIAALALLSAGALRAAEWLFVLCVLTAFVAISLAATGGRSLLGLVAGAAAWPIGALRAIPWTARGLAALRRARTAATLRIAAAVAVAALFLLIFGSLLASADEVFAKVIDVVTPDLGLDAVPRWIFMFVAGAAGLLGAAFLASAPPDLSGLEVRDGKRLRRLEWLIPVVALDVLFAAFVAVQFTVLFGGPRYVLGPGGPDFADYARKGFWQLLLVTLLTLAVLGAAARWAPRETPGDRTLIRAVLGALAGFSLVIVASALYRMYVYEEAYGFTRLRLLVSVCELWLGGIFVMVLAAGVRLRGAWVPRAMLATAMAALIGLVALNPDRFIADRNIDRFQQIGRIDVGYLSDLSADAVPAYDRLPPELRACALDWLEHDLARTTDGWQEWNLGRWQARRTLAANPPPQVGIRGCY